MKVTILGWYGTETLGDRAILASIIKLLDDSLGHCYISLGSLYPFFSQRTIDEDKVFWNNIMEIDPEINLFDSQDISELDKHIKNSDFVIIGGGPLMHITPMYMIRYALKKAKKTGKMAALLGCGVGPLFSNSFQNCFLDILENSDLTILRDSKSLTTQKNIEKNQNRFIKKRIITSIDPSVFACVRFKNKYIKEKGDFISVNLRKYPKIYSNQSIASNINYNLTQFLKNLSEERKNQIIKLIPMHYFHLGGDDREFIKILLSTLEENNTYIQEKPLNLFKTMEVFHNSSECFGMRLHSVIFQTILNGNNFILDYTEPTVGKISGFLEVIDENDFYKKRYINLQTNSDYSQIITENKQIFSYSSHKISQELNKYTKELKNLF
jgi:polysaccharide pyruvyl transferase WcaK-like protein